MTVLYGFAIVWGVCLLFVIGASIYLHVTNRPARA